MPDMDAIRRHEVSAPRSWRCLPVVPTLEVEPLDPRPTFWPPEPTLWTFKHRHELGHTPRRRKGGRLGDAAVAIGAIILCFLLFAAWLGLL